VPGAREQWARTKAVFLEALEYEAPERGAFVRRACGDDVALREEVESLLESDRAAQGFCEAPAAELLLDDLRATPEATRLQPGARLGNYEIEGFIAAGGMGEVYRARHVLLGREVALKTVGRWNDDEASRHRLIREARHAATLAHPGICTVHEVGEEAGVPFIVMEFVAGRPLADVVRESRPSLENALDIAVQVADALDHAHRRGILHRDLKSSNVMVDSAAHAVVLDFGLAKRVREPGSDARESTLTGAGNLAGTLSYMAPEVLQGGRADARSDIWSLGVLMFELLTGELPFAGRTPFETSSAILADRPRRMEPGVPLALRLVVERCLTKDPNARYQRAAAVRDALDTIRRRHAWPLVGRLLVVTRWRTLAAVAAGAAAVSAAAAAAPALRERFGNPLVGRVSRLAVLPLGHSATDPGAQYHASGMTDGLVAQLGALADVRIISPASTARIVGASASLADAARRLGVHALVEGRLQKVADRLVVDVRIVEPRRGHVVWSDRHERPVRDALLLQSDVVRALAAEVRLTVRPSARDRVAAARAVNAEAYEAYLNGRFEWNKRTRESLQLAVAQFQRAIELDPTFAPAHAALADCYNQFGTLMVGTGPPREFRSRAAAEAIKALQIDPYSAEGHATLGYVRHYEWQWDEAEREFRRAIDLDPNYPLARIWYANLLMSRRRWEAALEQMRLARELDPYSLIVNTNLGWALTSAGRTDEAIAQLEQTIALDSTYWHAHWRLVHPLLTRGRYADALAEAQTLVRLVDGAAPAVALLAQVEVQMGDTPRARERLRGLVARSRREYVPPGSIGAVFGALGDRETQLRYMQLAVGERANAVAFMRVDPDLVSRDSVYRSLVKRVGLQ
jgi:TolB-like protein/tetratricopeptide (TPR) repeat protein/predicted Ser/Thr protein kinase